MKALPNLRLLLLGQREIRHLEGNPSPVEYIMPDGGIVSLYWTWENPCRMQRNDYDVSDSIRTTDPTAVGPEVLRLYSKLFSPPNPPAPEPPSPATAPTYPP